MLKDEAYFRKSLEANADAIFVHITTKLGHEMDLPLSQIIDPVEKEKQIKKIIEKQLKAQEKQNLDKQT